MSTSNCSLLLPLQCQCGLTAASGGRKLGRHCRRPAAGAETEVQGAHHHLAGRRRRAGFIQEKQDTERQKQKPPTERQRRLSRAETLQA